MRRRRATLLPLATLIGAEGITATRREAVTRGATSGCSSIAPSPLYVEPIQFMILHIYRLLRIIGRTRNTTSARLFVIFARISALMAAWFATFLHTSIYWIWKTARHFKGINSSWKNNGWVGVHETRSTSFLAYLLWRTSNLTIYFFGSGSGSGFLLMCGHLYYIIT